MSFHIQQTQALGERLSVVTEEETATQTSPVTLTGCFVFVFEPCEITELVDTSRQAWVLIQDCAFSWTAKHASQSAVSFGAGAHSSVQF